MPGLDEIRYQRAVPREAQRGLLAIGEFLRLLEGPDVSDPIGVDAHHVKRVRPVRLAVLAATGNARHREKLAA